MKTASLLLLSCLPIFGLWGIMLLDAVLNGPAPLDVWEGAAYVTAPITLYCAVVFLIAWGFYRIIHVPYMLCALMAFGGGIYPIWYVLMWS